MASWADLDDRRSCALQVHGVVEVADQDVASVQAALAAVDYHHAVWVDITVERHGGGDSTRVTKTTDERWPCAWRCHGRGCCRQSDPRNRSYADDCGGEPAIDSHSDLPFAPCRPDLNEGMLRPVAAPPLVNTHGGRYRFRSQTGDGGIDRDPGTQSYDRSEPA